MLMTVSEEVLARAFPDLRLLSLDRRVADNANALGIGYGTT